jgi:3-phenylpropionate/cinnamic acid dioxygenase small subunit
MGKTNIALLVALAALLAVSLCQANAAEDGVTAATPREGVIGEGYKSVSLSDRAEIMDLIYGYSHTVDAGDLDGFVSLFTEDCRWIAKLPQGTILLDSRAKLREHIAKRLQYFADNGIQTRHLQMNTILTRIGYDRVQGVTYLTLLGQVKGEATPRLFSTGIYNDEFVQTEEGWRFAVREATLDQGRLPGLEK